MTAQLDHFSPEEKKVYVVAGVTIGLILAIISTALRIWAKLLSTKRVQGEDGFMIAGLLCGIGTASCLFYGKSLAPFSLEINNAAFLPTNRPIRGNHSADLDTLPQV